MSAWAEAEAEARRNWAPRPDLDEGLNGKHSREVPPDNGDGIHTDAGHRPEADPEADDALTIDGDAWEPAEVPRRPWVAKGYLLRGAVTLVAGPPSALKSSLMLSWASSVALNKRFGEFRPVEAGVAIVYNVEDDQNEQKRRLEATLRQFGASPNDIAGKVFRVSPRSIGTLLTRGLDGKPQFTPAMQRLERLVAEHRPAVFIADPFSELHVEEENDNTSVRAVVAMFREFAVKHNMTVVILHHTRKGASHAAGDPDIARGASSIVGAVRIAVTLTSMSEDDAKAFGLSTGHKARSHYVRLDDAKSNYAPLREAQWFEKMPYELANGEIVPAAVPWTPPEAKVASPQDLTALAAAIASGCSASNDEPWSPKLSKDRRSVKALLEQHGFAGGEAQQRVLEQLERDFGLKAAGYRRPSNRTFAQGYRIDGRPAADWRDQDV